MKIIIIVVFAVLTNDVRSQDWHAKWDSAGKTWNEKWTNTLDSLSSFSPSERMEILGSAVRIRPDTSNSERNEIFERAKSTLLSIPGHAEYFGKRIREAYEPLKGSNGGAAIGKAQNEMMYSFGTLKNLPIPETVKVLGEMLSETWRMKQPPPGPGGELEYTPPSLALSAVASALMELPLRMPPMMPTVMFGEDPEVVMVQPWQDWYSEIKSGKRTFSFKGQAVEYRFKPDGTWETIAMANPPDDGPQNNVEVRAPEQAPRPAKQALPPPTPQATSPSRSYWWIIGCCIAALLTVAFLFKRRHAS